MLFGLQELIFIRLSHQAAASGEGGARVGVFNLSEPIFFYDFCTVLAVQVALFLPQTKTNSADSLCISRLP